MVAALVGTWISVARRRRAHLFRCQTRSSSSEESAGDPPEEESVEHLDDISKALRIALTKFEAEVSKPDEDIDLVSAAALLALHADPMMDPYEAVLNPITDLAHKFRAHIGVTKDACVADAAEELQVPESICLHARAEALCNFMAEQGFTGCPQTEDGYYDASNSRLDHVLQRRQGIPITLSLVYMEVARAGGLELQGMNFPGHFLLGFGQGDSAGLVDAFSNRTISEEQTEQLLGRLFGQKIKLADSWRQARPLPNMMFLARMVRNLQNVYDRQGNLAQAAQVAQYSRVLETANSCDQP